MTALTTTRSTRSDSLQGQSTPFFAIVMALLINAVTNQNNVEAFHLLTVAPSSSLQHARRSLKPIISKPRSNTISHLSSRSNHEEYPKITFDLEVVGSSDVGSIAPKRIKRLKKRRKKMRSKKGKNSTSIQSGPLSEEELAIHVSSQYVTGPGGMFKQVDARRQRQEAAAANYFSNGQSNEDSQEQVAHLKKLDRHPSLVLNADYQPLSVLPLSLWSWQETIKAVFSGKVTVVDVYTGISIKAVNVDVPLPSVIALTEYVAQPKQRPAFTRRNVFLRDGYMCQYCSKRHRTNDLTLDHVVPRCVGGKLDWENAVTCCKKCNGRKGSIMPNEIHRVGMKLLREPRAPTKYELAAEASKMAPRRVHPTWQPFVRGNTMSNQMESSSLEHDSRRYFDSF